MSADPPAATGPRPRRRSYLPGSGVAPWRRSVRYRVSRLVAGAFARAWMRPRLEGRDHLPPGSAVYCFNHQNWSDPFMLMAVLPMRPRLYFFGPKEDDMHRGGRNRLIMWTGSAVPYRPGKNDLLDALRAVQAIFASGGVLAIAGEGRIHAGESVLLPLSDGPAFFAIRSGVPLVPIAINGMSWLRFGGRVRIRVGEPIQTSGRPTHERVEELTQRLWVALHELVADYPDPEPPGRLERWLTERFNEWPEGARPSVGTPPSA